MSATMLGMRGASRSGLVLAATLVLVSVGLALGFWQLSRAQQKTQLAQAISERAKLPALDNASLLSANTAAQSSHAWPWLHRRALLRGRWLHEWTVFLDNRSMSVGGAAPRFGFYVVTPLKLEGLDAVIWVQRGWVARDFQDREKLPQLAQTDALVQVEGRLEEGVSRVYEMAASDRLLGPGQALSSRIWQNLPALDFHPSVLVRLALLQTRSETSDASDILLRQWPDRDTGVAKHHGYAFQWFALSGTLIVLYVWFQFIAPRRRKNA